VAIADEIVGRYLANDIVNEATGEIYAEAGDEIARTLFKQLTDLGHQEIVTLAIDHLTVGSYPQHPGRAMPTAPVKRPCSQFTALCAPVSRQHWIRPPSCFKACSLTAIVMTFPRLVGSK
jgi:hypothetical protein